MSKKKFVLLLIVILVPILLTLFIRYSQNNQDNFKKERPTGRIKKVKTDEELKREREERRMKREKEKEKEEEREFYSCENYCDDECNKELCLSKCRKGDIDNICEECGECSPYYYDNLRVSELDKKLKHINDSRQEVHRKFPLVIKRNQHFRDLENELYRFRFTEPERKDNTPLEKIIEWLKDKMNKPELSDFKDEIMLLISVRYCILMDIEKMEEACYTVINNMPDATTFEDDLNRYWWIRTPEIPITGSGLISQEVLAKETPGDKWWELAVMHHINFHEMYNHKSRYPDFTSVYAMQRLGNNYVWISNDIENPRLDKPFIKGIYEDFKLKYPNVKYEDLIKKSYETYKDLFWQQKHFKEYWDVDKEYLKGYISKYPIHAPLKAEYYLIRFEDYKTFTQNLSYFSKQEQYEITHHLVEKYNVFEIPNLELIKKHSQIAGELGKYDESLYYANLGLKTIDYVYNKYADKFEQKEPYNGKFIKEEWELRKNDFMDIVKNLNK